MARIAVRLLAVPLRSGSLYPGSENDAKGYRDAGLSDLLRDAGVPVIDEGDIEIPSYLPHHSVPPIRNWPGPRIVWDLIRERLEPILKSPDQLPILIGCDCSIVVGTAQALQATGNVHVVYIDGDFDDAYPDPAITRSGAALAVWLLTNASPFSPVSLPPENVTVVGWSNGPFAGSTRVGSVPLEDIRRIAPAAAIAQVLRNIPEDAVILVHFDVDAIRRRDLPAAYFPHIDGLSLEEAGAILDVVLSDHRVGLVEVSEYAALRDLDGQSALTIARLLAHGLAKRAAQ